MHGNGPGCEKEDRRRHSSMKEGSGGGKVMEKIVAEMLDLNYMRRR